MFEEMRRVDKIKEDESKAQSASRDIVRNGEQDGLLPDDLVAVRTDSDANAHPVLEPPDVVQVPDEFDDEDDEASECNIELHSKVQESGPSLCDDNEGTPME